MDLYYDLHIHSALSPCADPDMTPNNIINMASLKGLDIISITDHNSYFNSKVIMELGEKNDILVIPGIEVTTSEDIHILCYFNDIYKLEEFGEEIFNSLHDIKNNIDYFGEQEIFNIYDEKILDIDKLLINSSKYNLDKIIQLVKSKKGIVIPAHVDKKSYSILSVLGFIPLKYNIKFIEVKNKKYKNKIINRYNKIYNSDAHFLGDISERINKLQINKKTASEVLNYFKMGCDY